MKSIRPFNRRFGKTGLAFPEVGLGTWTFSGKEFGRINDNEVSNVIRGAQCYGIRYFDTADIYGRGRCEKYLSDNLDNKSRPYVATKVGNDFRCNASSVKNFDKEYIVYAIEQSAARLKTKCLDIVYLHNPPEDVVKSGVVFEELKTLKEKGLISYIGISTVRESDIRLLGELPRIDVVQIPFNILNQSLLYECHEKISAWGGAVVIRSPLEFGMLSGKLPEIDALEGSDYRKRAWTKDVERKFRATSQELKNWAEKKGGRLSEMAIKFCLFPDVVSNVIPGCRNIRQLKSNISVSRLVKPYEMSDMIDIDNILRNNQVDSFAKEIYEMNKKRAKRRREDGSILSRPLEVGGLRIRNRIFRSGTTERLVNHDGAPKKELEEVYKKLAIGGVGLITTGYISVSEAGRASTSHYVLHNNSQKYIWKRLIENVKKVSPDIKLCAQIAHGGNLSLGDEKGDIVELFVNSAVLAQEAGFDAIQLHIAHGYYLNQIISRECQALRCGRQGQSIRIISEIVKKIKRKVRKGFPIMAKINVSDFLCGGITPELSIKLAEILAAEGLDAIEWSGWTKSASAEDGPSRKGEFIEMHEGSFAAFVAEAKKQVPKMVMGSCSGFVSQEGMLNALSSLKHDFVAISRPLIVEPDLPNQIMGGKRKRGICNGCNKCMERNGPTHCPEFS